jgi:Putative peptidoglycan binding domain
MWRTLCLGMALTLTIPCAAEAADANSRFQAYGIGRIACKRFVEICEGKQEQCRLTGTWLEGYLSAFNALNANTFDLLPWQQPELVAQLAFDSCKNNPDVAVLEMINGVIGKLLVPERVKTAAERVKIGDGDGAVLLYRETVRSMQERLAAAGHLKGKPDGAFGPGTAAALSSFQKAVGLKETGLPDQRTLLALFYGAAGRPAPGAQPAPVPAAPAAQAAPKAQTPPAKLDLNLIPKTP